MSEMATKDKDKDGASAGRKPWRYYYVMALPLGGSSGVTQDKVGGWLHLYLRRVPKAY